MKFQMLLVKNRVYCLKNCRTYWYGIDRICLNAKQAGFFVVEDTPKLCRAFVILVNGDKLYKNSLPSEFVLSLILVYHDHSVI